MADKRCYMFCSLFHPIYGIDEDLSNFCQKFEATGSIRFTKFAELWRNEKFFHIVYGRGHQVGLSDFLGCIFFRLVDLVQPKTGRSHSTRVCSLYLLYALHGKQFIKNNVRIRVCPETWPGFLQLSQEAKDDGHLDVYYVFKQLCAANAFAFCINRQVLYPGVPLFNSPRLEPPSSDASQSADPISLYTQFLKPPKNTSPDIREAVTCLEQGIIQYTEVKSALNSMKPVQDESATSPSTEASNEKKEEFIPGLNFITYPDTMTTLFSIVDRMSACEDEERTAGRYILEEAHSDTDVAHVAEPRKQKNRRGMRKKHVLKQRLTSEQSEMLEVPESTARDSLGERRKRLKQPSTWSLELEEQAASVRAHGCRRNRRRPTQAKHLSIDKSDT